MTPTTTKTFSAFLIFLIHTIALNGASEPLLVWSDEFETDGLPDPAKWTYDVGGHGWGNGEAQYYTSSETRNARVENGRLVIEAHHEPQREGNQYTSARLVSRGLGDWRYGRIEVRAKLPQGRGTWPAIWMLPTDWVFGGWPASGEIDIMEHVGYDPNVIHGTVHTADLNHTKGTQMGGSLVLDDAFETFHTYRIDWFADRIEWFIDDQRFFSFENRNEDFRTWPFDERFHLLLNIAVGGSWGGVQGIDPTVFPQQMVIDYVRVYDLGEGNSDSTGVHLIPGRIEAEDYSRQQGIRLESTSDAGGGSNLGYLSQDDWFEFELEVPTAGLFAIDARYASPQGSAGLILSLNGEQTTSAMLNQPTGGWQAWSTASIGQLELPAGRHTFRLTVTLTGVEDLNLNWIEFRSLSPNNWAYWPIESATGPTVNTGSFLGYLELSLEPFLWSYSLGGWIYLPETNVQSSGAWAYIYNF